MTRIRRLLSTAKARLVGRAVFAGVSAFAVFELGATEPFTNAALHGAAVAAMLATAEYFTPLNALVGAFKKRIGGSAPPARP